MKRKYAIWQMRRSGRRFNIETAYIIYEEYETRYKPIIG